MRDEMTLSDWLRFICVLLDQITANIQCVLGRNDLRGDTDGVLYLASTQRPSWDEHAEHVASSLPGVHQACTRAIRSENAEHAGQTDASARLAANGQGSSAVAIVPAGQQQPCSMEGVSSC